MSSISQTAGRSEANLRFSRKLATLQLLAVLALALIIGVTATVFARQQAVSANSAERKAVAGSIATLEAGLKAATLAHAVSGAAYEAVRAADHASFWRNVAHGEIASGTTDIMVAVDPLRGTRFAWGAQSGPEPSDQILPAGLVDDMAQRADAAADGPRGAVSRFARFDGQTWLLAAARMTRNDGVPEDATGANAPRLILGFRLDGGRLAQLGGLFGIEGLTVTDAPSAGAGALRLGGQAEGAGFATWTSAPVALAVDVWIVLVLAASLVALTSWLFSRHAVASARRLERAVEAAQAADWAKTEFLSNVSHELRTPMNGILGMAQLMQTMQLDDKLRKMVDVVASSARSQMTLIEDLIDVSRIDSGFRGLSNAPFGPLAALDEVCGPMELKAEAKGVDLVVSAPKEAGQQVLGDIACFKQILTNLIDNAVKFTEKGKIEVTLGLATRNDQTWVRVEVSDTGPGISPENHERIFNRFGRLDGQLARSARGMGLGLAIARALAELMGGSIALQSELGKGARFTVDIPFEQPIYPAMYRRAAE